MSDSKKVHKYFAQPIFQYQLESYERHNQELKKYIYNAYNEDPNGLSRSNQGGWHSKPFDLKDKSSAPFTFFQSIQKYVADVFKEYGWLYVPGKVNLTEMWAIINKKNNFNIEHTHPNNYLSAAYYVKAPENCGSFIVTNPILYQEKGSLRVKEKQNSTNIYLKLSQMREIYYFFQLIFHIRLV